MVIEAEQGAGVAGRQHARSNTALDRYGQVEQPDRVAHLRAATADPMRKLVMGGAELLEKLLVRSCLFQRIELGAVNVLEQRVTQHGVIASGPDDCWDDVQPGGNRRP